MCILRTAISLRCSLTVHGTFQACQPKSHSHCLTWCALPLLGWACPLVWPLRLPFPFPLLPALLWGLLISGSSLRRVSRSCTTNPADKQRTGKITPFGVNSTRSLVIYRAAQNISPAYVLAVSAWGVIFATLSMRFWQNFELMRYAVLGFNQH